MSVSQHLQSSASNQEAAEYGELFAKEQQTSIDSSRVRVYVGVRGTCVSNCKDDLLTVYHVLYAQFILPEEKSRQF